MRKSFMKKIISPVITLCLLTMTGTNLTSCQQEESKDLFSILCRRKVNTNFT